MKIDDQAIGGAFEQHHKQYVSAGTRAWDIEGHVECWKIAYQAFEQDSSDKFKELYDHLRKQWQVFRGASEYWSAKQTFSALKALPQAWRGKHLSELTLADAQRCRQLLDSVAGIKPLKEGVSVVAISKFLHFWNPRLFVIVDRGVMWRWVFQHDWLWQQVSAFACNLPRPQLVKPDENCDLPCYLAILLWSAEVIRNNPTIIEHFARYVQKHSTGIAHDLPLATYEAAAMEWLLLGLVERPPVGVSELS
jgi:hypothetical protein